MINGIDILKEKYPDRNNKDYQPAGLDLRIGKLYEYDPHQDSFAGIIGGNKILPPLRQVKPIFVNDMNDHPYECFELKPHTPYIAEVATPIKIDVDSAQFYKPRSTLLRSFVTVSTALGDPGYNGHLQFLLINHGFNPYYLEFGERFAQLIDIRVDENHEVYDGDYQETDKDEKI